MQFYSIRVVAVFRPETTCRACKFMSVCKPDTRQVAAVAPTPIAPIRVVPGTADPDCGAGRRQSDPHHSGPLAPAAAKALARTERGYRNETTGLTTGTVASATRKERYTSETSDSIFVVGEVKANYNEQAAHSCVGVENFDKFASLLLAIENLLPGACVAQRAIEPSRRIGTRARYRPFPSARGNGGTSRKSHASVPHDHWSCPVPACGAAAGRAVPHSRLPGRSSGHSVVSVAGGVAFAQRPVLSASSAVVSPSAHPDLRCMQGEITKIP